MYYSEAIQAQEILSVHPFDRQVHCDRTKENTNILIYLMKAQFLYQSLYRNGY